MKFVRYLQNIVMTSAQKWTKTAISSLQSPFKFQCQHTRRHWLPLSVYLWLDCNSTNPWNATCEAIQEEERGYCKQYFTHHWLWKKKRNYKRILLFYWASMSAITSFATFFKMSMFITLSALDANSQRYCVVTDLNLLHYLRLQLTFGRLRIDPLNLNR